MTFTINGSCLYIVALNPPSAFLWGISPIFRQLFAEDKTPNITLMGGFLMGYGDKVINVLPITLLAGGKYALL